MNSPERINTDTDISALSYEQARDQLVAVVRQLENGSLPLQDSMDLWEFGEKLTAHCKNYLQQARAKVEEATGQRQNDR